MCLAAWVLLLGAAAAIPLQAKETGWRLRMELVSEVNAIQAGEPFTVALHLEHEAAWHTYWSNPGLVGVPTSMVWTLPEGFAAGPIQWPPPMVVPMASVKAYGYEDEAFLLVEITPPKDLPQGEIRLAAQVAYMACATTCHPGYEDLELMLPASEKKVGKPDWNSHWRSALEATRSTFPVALRGWKATVVRKGDEIRLRMVPEAGEKGRPNRNLRQAYFFSLDDQVNSDKPQKVRPLKGGGLELSLSPSFYGPEDAETFEGVLYSEEGWLAGGEGKAMTLRLPWSAQDTE